VVVKGEIAKAAHDAWRHGNGEIKDHLDYPFMYLERGLIDPRSAQNELFARLGELWYTNPELLKKIPSAYKLFEEISPMRKTFTYPPEVLRQLQIAKQYETRFGYRPPATRGDDPNKTSQQAEEAT